MTNLAPIKITERVVDIFDRALVEEDYKAELSKLTDREQNGVLLLATARLIHMVVQFTASLDSYQGVERMERERMIAEARAVINEQTALLYEQETDE